MGTTAARRQRKSTFGEKESHPFPSTGAEINHIHALRSSIFSHNYYVRLALGLEHPLLMQLFMFQLSYITD